jgi:hypothetical protein
MEQCQSLRVLSLKNLGLNENHCRVLGACSRPDLDINLDRCKVMSAGMTCLAEVLGRNQGPTKVDSGDVDFFVLADGLRGNSRLKSLTPNIFAHRDEGNQELLAILDALRENKGLVDLNLENCFRMSVEAWDAACESLKTHPTLQTLQLVPLHTCGGIPELPPDMIRSRIQAIVEMMKVNMTIHTIRLHSFLSDHELFRESVIPYLETNRLRPCLLAIQKTRPIAYRTKVLGAALLAVRTDPNCFWMLLSGNAEVAFPSTTATTALAATLP